MSLHPYLMFTDTTRAAMTRYQEILGGTLDIMGLDDLPPNDAEQMPTGLPADMVIHAALAFGDGDLLMASDDPSGDGQGIKGAALNITLTDHDEAHRVYDDLADGGEVQMPLGQTFWSPLFGTCVDRFGVTWMVNVDGDVDGSDQNESGR